MCLLCVMCMSVYMHMCIHMCMCRYMYMYVYIYIYMIYIYIYIYIYIADALLKPLLKRVCVLQNCCHPDTYALKTTSNLTT
jgi:hypothetical protein